MSGRISPLNKASALRTDGCCGIGIETAASTSARDGGAGATSCATAFVSALRSSVTSGATDGEGGGGAGAVAHATAASASAGAQNFITTSRPRLLCDLEIDRQRLCVRNIAEL